jgi:hypothetical protein
MASRADLEQVTDRRGDIEQGNSIFIRWFQFTTRNDETVVAMCA